MANLLQNAIEIVKFLETLKIWAFLRKTGRFPDTKYWIFSKPLIIKGRKFAVESDWARKNSQNIESLGFLKKTDEIYWCFLKPLEVEKMPRKRLR